MRIETLNGKAYLKFKRYPESYFLVRLDQSSSFNLFNDKAIGDKEFIGLIESEPKVKHAVITSERVLYAFVNDDGTNRDGYANYLAELVYIERCNIKQVRVVKVNSILSKKADDYGVILGLANCVNFEISKNLEEFIFSGQFLLNTREGIVAFRIQLN
jgi:hypothetical protein